MIQSLDNLLWLRQPTGRLEPVDEYWLADFLRDRLGNDAEEFVTPMAEALFEHLHAQATGHPIAAAELDRWVGQLVDSLNLRPVELPAAGRAEIRLDELAVESGSGFELGFFRALSQRLHQFAQQPRAQVRLRGLRRCVLYLRGQQRWSEGCRQLAREIYEFIYGHVKLSAGVAVAIMD